MIVEKVAVDSVFGQWLSKNDADPVYQATSAELMFQYIDILKDEQAFEELHKVDYRKWVKLVTKIAGADDKRRDLIVVLNCPELVRFIDKIRDISYYSTGALFNPKWLKTHLCGTYGMVSVGRLSDLNGNEDSNYVCRYSF